MKEQNYEILPPFKTLEAGGASSFWEIISLLRISVGKETSIGAINEGRGGGNVCFERESRGWLREIELKVTLAPFFMLVYLITFLSMILMDGCGGDGSCSGGGMQQKGSI